MRFLGVDPGSHITGYGIIESEPRLCIVEYGCIRLAAKTPLPKRLAEIYDRLTGIILSNQIGTVCVEEAFFAENAKTALVLGHARGVILLAAQNTKAEIHEYSPREIKKSVTGNGAASKEQVQWMIQKILGADRPIEPIDASDALAVALCHANRSHARFA